MQTSTVLVAVLFAVTSFPFLGQGSPQDSSPTSTGRQQQAAPATNPGTSAVPGSQPEQASPSATADAQASLPSAPAPDFKPVSAELVGNLDTKTAKSGDSVIVQTKSNVKTADGTDMPKGTKLVGHVVGAQASSAGETSQVAVQFDHAELSGGKSVPIQSQIQSVGSADVASSSGAAPSPSGMSRGTMANPNSSAGSVSASSTQSQVSGAAQADNSSQSPTTDSGTGTKASTGVEPGTVVAKTGLIDIRTTAVPGVLVANNQPGQQDPRMAHASSVLLGAHKDVQLSGGTPLVMGVATTGASTVK